MAEHKHTRAKTEKTGGRGVRILLIVLVLLLAGGFAIWHFTQPAYNDRLEPNAVVGTMPGKSKEQIEAELTQKVSEKEVAFSINANPTFETPESKGNILFENPKSNKKLTRVEITLDSDGTLLYKSGLLEPGSYIPEAKLLETLDYGSYPCTATIYAYALSDESFIGKVAAGLTLVIGAQ